MDDMSAPIPCATCGWREEAHLFPDLYPQCAHEYVSQCRLDQPRKSKKRKAK
jgi:hypothetical protein